MDDVLKILLVDDDAIDRMAVKRALRAAGLTAEVTEAKDGVEGLAVMKAGVFDCVLLDYRLPDSDGLSVLREARAAGVVAPVIMLTGQGDEELAVEIMKAGASDYLTKSRVSLDHLQQSIRSAVRVRRAEEQVDEAHALLATLLMSAPIGMAFLDRELRFVRMNDALAAINGAPAIKHLGMTVSEMMPGISAAMTGHLRQVLGSGAALANVDVRGSTLADPHAVHDFLVSYFPVRSAGGEMLGVGLTLTDITERKRAEADLKQAKEAAEAANKAKDQFLAVLSHELRTPLTPVLATVEELEEDASLTEAQRESVQMIRRNVELEARLIDDLLDLTRISKGKLRLTMGTVSAYALLNSVFEICEPEAAAKGLELDAELNASRFFVRADSARMQQILWNLIKNAVKFTPAGGRIVVTTENDETGALRVRVTDTGIGIEPEVLPRIFDAFEQGEQSVTRQFGGLGLGLAITRALVEGHGGKLTAASEGKGRGATFTLWLPTVEAPVRAAPEPRESRRTARRVEAACDAAQHLRILLVDDHEDTSRAMKRLLERVGYEVKTASSVAGALEVAGEAAFDLLISDIGLPDGSGLDLVKQLKEKIERGEPLKAIALSGFGMEEDLQKSREAGFMEHLTKPVNFQQLETAIQALTGR